MVDETVEAVKAGADYALVLIPSFFHFAMDSNAIINFFQEVRRNTFEECPLNANIMISIAG